MLPARHPSRLFPPCPVPAVRRHVPGGETERANARDRILTTGGEPHSSFWQCRQGAAWPSNLWHGLDDHPPMAYNRAAIPPDK